ncbi:unnamed protein product [Rotaria magnacalcarata]|uniref:Cilia- and flagella-associated protein 43 n=1 Tax=Rotaria magnacalcarata TaxID=392030 RepID=A0A816AC78_9BILA|nr:unnamed protein product [Rotaria magnacalcarata]
MAVRATRLQSAKPLTLSRWWTNGYHGQSIAFVDQTVLFYAVDDGLRFHDFVDPSNQTCLTVQANGIGVGVITGNADMHLFAFADYQSPPIIHLQQYPSLQEIKQFTGGAELEYSALEFSATEELLSLSTSPDYLLTIWNWRTGVKLAQCETTKKPPVEISFNPNSWYDIGILYRDQINLYTCERQNDKYVLFERPLTLELFNQTVAHNQPTYQQTKTKQSNPLRVADVIRRFPSRFSFTLVDSTIGTDQGTSVKLVAFDTENEDAFQTYIDEKIQLVATSFCWGDKGYIFIGTADDSLIQVLLQFDREKQPFRATRFAEEEKFKTTGSIGMFKKISLHKHGLFCAGADDIVRLVTFENQDGALQEANNVSDVMDLSANITTVTFNPAYNNLFICSKQGVDILDLISMEPKQPSIIPIALGKIVDIATVNPTNEIVVTIRDTGALEAWSIKDGSRKFCEYIENQTINHLVTSPVLPFMVVTSKTGIFYFYELNKAGFRLIHRLRVHGNEIRCIKFNPHGTLLVSVGMDNSLFLMEIKPDETYVDNIFQIIYRTDLDGEPFALDLDDFGKRNTIDGDDVQHDYDDEHIGNIQEKSNETRIVIALNAKTEKYGRFFIVDFDWQQYRESRTLQTSITSDSYMDYVINDSATKIITKTNFAFHDAIEDFLITARNQLITVGGTSLRMCRIPDEIGKPGKLTSVEAQDSLAGLSSAGGHLYKNKTISSWVICISRDGILSMIRASDMAVESSLPAHSSISRGCCRSAWSVDSKYIVSVAEDNSIVVFETKYAGRFGPNLSYAPEELNHKMRNLATLVTYENATSALYDSINDRFRAYEKKFQMVGMVPPSGPKEDSSWLQLKEYEATLQNLDAHLTSKIAIHNELERIRKELHELMAINGTREEKAQLDRREFDLDSEEQERQRKEKDATISKMRDETITKNLVRLMKREVIKQQCWDSMSVKGRCIEGIINPIRKQAAPIVVENYPLLPRSLEEVENIRQVIERRRIEIAEKKLRRQIFSESSTVHETSVDVPAREDPSTLDNEEEHREQKTQSIALIGSVSNEFQVDTSILYNQFELYTPEQKWTQIVLLNNLIYKIKEAFNKEFETAYQRKLQELAKIREKNIRIKQINADLDDTTPVWEPDLTEKEKPILLFDVKDSEVKVERYYTPEQLKQLEEQRLNEERRRQMEKLDNWRERGLNEMMGGVLQVRREDELKKEIPKPPFAVEKPEDEWTEMEKQVYQQYLQRVKEQQEERDKLRKVLSTEASKINEQIQENCDAFEQILIQLHRRRILAQTAVIQEELKISRLVFALVKDRLIEQLEETYEKRAKTLEGKVHELELSKRALEDSLNNIDSDKRRLKADDTFDKQFPREFADVPSALQDSLKRLLTKRPKLKQTKTVDEFNPYTARQMRLLELEFDKIQADADSFTNAPPSIVRNIWERFVDFRKRRGELERDLRLQEQEELVIKNLKNIRETELTRKNMEFEQIQNLLTASKDARIDDTFDLYVQIVLKQGQIEMEAQPADLSPDQYRNTDVELVNRHEIEDLNKAIIESANLKIRHMEKTKGVVNELQSMKWEKEKLTFEITDLKQRAQDITFLKVTRNVQEYLACRDDTIFESHKQRELQMLEATIEKMKQRFEDQKHIKENEIHKLQHNNLSIANVTLAVDEALQNANVNLYERKNIIDQRIVEQSKVEQQDRIQQVVRRRRLVDLAKAQAQEVAYLRAEVERLRMKTFPALVQIEH